jgi:hypothetical protein
MVDKIKKPSPTEGFNVFADFIIGNKDMVPKLGDDADKDAFQDIDPEDLKKKLDGDVEPDDKKIDDKKVDDKKVNDKKDDKKVEDKKIEDEPTIPIKTDEDKEYESEISSFFAGELVKKLGVDADTKDLKFDNIDDVIELMSEIVNENSKPTYASDEVEKYDEFVRNGGTLKDFYKEVYSGKLDPSSLDLEKEYDQRAVIRENLLNQGYKEEKIKKMISRYEESETLKEEAEDAVDLLKEFNQKKQDSLLEEQRKNAELVRRQQQKFYEDVNSNIKTISNFRGFPISEKEKRELLQYAFVPDEDGITKYQKDLRSDVYNILESAYFAKNRDKVKVDNVNKGDTDAYKTLRDKLKARSNKTVDNNKDDSKGKLGSGSLGDFGKSLFG